MLVLRLLLQTRTRKTTTLACMVREAGIWSESESECESECEREAGSENENERESEFVFSPS